MNTFVAVVCHVAQHIVVASTLKNANICEYDD